MKKKNIRFYEEFKKENKKKFFLETRKIIDDSEKKYVFPGDNYADFEKNFIESELKNLLFIDKSQHAVDIILEEDELLFFNRPRRFGKSLFLNFLWYLYLYGPEDESLIKKYPHLEIYQNSFRDNSEWKLFKLKNYFPIYLNFALLDAKCGEEFNILLGKQLLKAFQYIKSSLQRKLELLDFLLVKNHDGNILIGKMIKFKEIITILEKISEGNCQDCMLIFSNLLKHMDGYKIILLIDEYETPIMQLLNNKSEKTQYFIEQYKWFFQYLKGETPRTFSKVIITGVLCLRHLGLFSGSNSFTNLSMKLKYKTTFGFTKNEIKENKNVKSTVISLLKKHQFISENQKIDQLESKFNEFLEKIFKHYNGFHFTEDLSDYSSVISPISFVQHMRTLNEQPSNPILPFKFSNYWAKTGQISIIKTLAPKNMNPYNLPKLLYMTKFSLVKIEDMDNVHDFIEIDAIPINILLFHTGYFSISKKINDKVELIWTNNETRRAFFKIYTTDLNFDEIFIENLFKNLKDKVTEEDLESKEIEVFFKNLQIYFLQIHNKYYQLGEIDHEHNFVYWFYFDVLNSLICNDSDLQIFLRWKLTDIQDDIRSGGEPDIIIHHRDLKITLIIEFQKTSNK